MSKKIIEIFSEFKKNISHFNKHTQKSILDAYYFSKKKHQKQLRRSGDPYIIHPLRVANNLAANKYDHVAIISALLHDLLEDTDTQYEEIRKIFGKQVADIVDGVTKISSIKIRDKSVIFSDEDMYISRVDNYRKILLATISDLRTIIIKLYDRLDNVETIEFIKDYKRKFYARETIEIYAPIAERLGMGEIKGKLEDLSFPYAYPDEYNDFIQEIENAYKNPQEVINEVTPLVLGLLKENDVNHHSVSGRAKHHFSLYNKLKIKKDLSFIFDIIALRIIVFNVADCYRVLGLIHTLYKPIPGRIFDYIAQPKKSGYQSLHTTVKDTKGNIFEIQIRTLDMHRNAEYGRAAHWNYKEKNNNNKNSEEWLQELEKIKEIQDGKDFITTIKEELFSQKIFVFTPIGEIIDLPRGSTGIDFAYQIHTELGHHCAGIRINNRIMPIKTPLETGDVVQIIKSLKAKPNKDWLEHAKTSSAKNKIKNFLREENFSINLEKGKNIFDEMIKKYHLPPLPETEADRKLQKSKIPYNDLESALISLGEKNLSKTLLVKSLYPSFKNEKIKKNHIGKNTIKIDALKNIKHSLAKCCKPKKNDEIVGYLTRKHIIKVHRKDCAYIKNGDIKKIIDLKC